MTMSEVDGCGEPMVTREDYRALAEFRFALRRFVMFSEAAAIGAGLTPQQHQALLAIKGFGGESGLTVGELANKLCLRPHSAAELVNRLADSGLVDRWSDPQDGRKVLVHLTAAAQERLAGLSRTHIRELQSARPALDAMLAILDQRGPGGTQREHDDPRAKED